MALDKYVDKLPIPPVLAPVSSDNGVDYYEVTMKEITQKLHRDLEPTTLYAYEGIYPGPTIVAESNKPIKVKWMNDLPVNPHLLPVDKTLHGAEGEYEVRTVVHLHGANVQPDSDGFPESWFTNNFEHVGPTFTNEVYYYPNKQPATTLFYHDHALGITRLNVYAGLAGAYIIRDEIEENLNLPKGEFEIPLVIQDRTFNSDGTLFYPTQPDNAIPGVTPNPSVVPEFFGDTILVNGKVWPYLEVRPQRYRFRIVNGSNARFYNIKLVNTGIGETPTWVQIGTDQGFLEAPVSLTGPKLTSLTLAPGERADTIIDFTGFMGSEFEFTNDAKAPFPMGDDPDADTSKIMRFKVVLPALGTDESEIPTSLTTIDWLDESKASKIRYSTLIETIDSYQRLQLLLDNLMWDDAITQKPKLNSIEVWNIVNTTVDTHPIHLHLVRFQILGRRPFEYDQMGNIVYTGPETPPDDNEKGFKDTVRANPGEVTRVIARFGDFVGVYPWHCHILEHEDHEMMRPYEVVKKHAK